MDSAILDRDGSPQVSTVKINGEAVVPHASDGAKHQSSGRCIGCHVSTRHPFKAFRTGMWDRL